VLPADGLLQGVGATERLGAALARSAPFERAQPLTVYLQGELGSGKTTLARALLRELGVVGTVRSPSYTLLERYALDGRLVLHLDLYRLRAAEELETLGVREELLPGVLLLVEWPERAAALLPPPDLRLGLGIPPGAGGTGEERSLHVDAGTPTGAAWLAQLATLD
jgi:tRNA threonylcarbamoyladenosine biosynthesis protein TsaE